MSDFGYILVGFFLGLVANSLMTANRRKRRIPTVLGSSVPLTPHTIDFARRYNISTASRFGEGAIREFHAVRIVGYVEKQDDTGSKFSGDWIVAELPDSRKLYLLPQSIQVMEEVPDEPKNA